MSSSITASSGANGGLGFNMWGVIVDNSGIVCAVAFSGGNFTYQWLASRVIAAQKANTANSLSLSQGVTPGASAVGSAGLALSTANLFSAVQPGGSLYGLQHSNPVDTDVAYGEGPGNSPPANASSFGTTSDPMVGQRIGGVNVFGGGLGLYKGGVRVGGLGVSGDQSCTDHMVAWRTRHTLNLDQLRGVTGPAALSPTTLPIRTTSSSTSRRTRTGARESARVDSDTRLASTIRARRRSLNFQQCSDFNARRWDGTIPALIAAPRRP